jgi:hypothetical protein
MNLNSLISIKFSYKFILAKYSNEKIQKEHFSVDFSLLEMIGMNSFLLCLHLLFSQKMLVYYTQERQNSEPEIWMADFTITVEELRDK